LFVAYLASAPALDVAMLQAKKSWKKQKPDLQGKEGSKKENKATK
jgi:hypothetical protein